MDNPTKPAPPTPRLKLVSAEPENWPHTRAPSPARPAARRAIVAAAVLFGRSDRVQTRRPLEHQPGRHFFL